MAYLQDTIYIDDGYNQSKGSSWIIREDPEYDTDYAPIIFKILSNYFNSNRIDFSDPANISIINSNGGWSSSQTGNIINFTSIGSVDLGGTEFNTATSLIGNSTSVEIKSGYYLHGSTANPNNTPGSLVFTDGLWTNFTPMGFVRNTPYSIGNKLLIARKNKTSGFLEILLYRVPLIMSPVLLDSLDTGINIDPNISISSSNFSIPIISTDATTAYIVTPIGTDSNKIYVIKIDTTGDTVSVISSTKVSDNRIQIQTGDVVISGTNKLTAAFGSESNSSDNIFLDIDISGTPSLLGEQIVPNLVNGMNIKLAYDTGTNKVLASASGDLSSDIKSYIAEWDTSTHITSGFADVGYENRLPYIPIVKLRDNVFAYTRATNTPDAYYSGYVNSYYSDGKINYDGNGNITIIGSGNTFYKPDFQYDGIGNLVLSGISDTTYIPDYIYDGKGIITIEGICKYTNIKGWYGKEITAYSKSVIESSFNSQKQTEDHYYTLSDKDKLYRSEGK